MNRLEKLKLTRLLSGGVVLLLLVMGFFSYPIWLLSESCCPCGILFYMDTKANCLASDEGAIHELDFVEIPTAVILVTESDSPFSGTCAVLPVFEEKVEYKGHSQKLTFSVKDRGIYLQDEEFSKGYSFISKSYLNPNPWMVDGIWIENSGDVSFCGQQEKGKTTLIEGADFTYFEPIKVIALLSVPFVVWLISSLQVGTLQRKPKFPSKHDLNSEESWWGSAARKKEEQQGDSEKNHSSE